MNHVCQGVGKEGSGFMENIPGSFKTEMKRPVSGELPDEKSVNTALAGEIEGKIKRPALRLVNYENNKGQNQGIGQHIPDSHMTHIPTYSLIEP